MGSTGKRDRKADEKGGSRGKRREKVRTRRGGLAEGKHEGVSVKEGRKCKSALTRAVAANLAM